ncbi:hypothetical protein LCGC14_1720410 [marine sediment metagenome]|uniref:Uncharacterized protein n=1 Tax=marine sediment metagenome TaxID=412755 RepID=A0A0F9I0D8_9ZZZZ
MPEPLTENEKQILEEILVNPRTIGQLTRDTPSPGGIELSSEEVSSSIASLRTKGLIRKRAGEHLTRPIWELTNKGEIAFLRMRGDIN